MHKPATKITTNCILCHSSNIQQCQTIKAFFRIWCCQKCTFTWVDRTDLDRPDATPSYDNYEYNYNLKNNFNNMKLLYIKGLQQRIARTLGDRSLQNCSFLDIGCANGEYLWAAKAIGFGKVAGVEIDSTAVQQAKVYGEVTDNVCKFPESSFDVVQIKNVLGNITDFVTFMNCCLKVLKPGGFLLLDVLNQDSLTALLRNNLLRRYQKIGRYGHLRPPYVVNGFNQASLKELYSRLGLNITWCATSYVGNPLVPYAPNFALKLMGLTGALVGKGTMLLTEAKVT